MRQCKASSSQPSDSNHSPKSRLSLTTHVSSTLKGANSTSSPKKSKPPILQPTAKPKRNRPSPRSAKLTPKLPPKPARFNKPTKAGAQRHATATSNPPVSTFLTALTSRNELRRNERNSITPTVSRPQPRKLHPSLKHATTRKPMPSTNSHTSNNKTTKMLLPRPPLTKPLLC